MASPKKRIRCVKIPGGSQFRRLPLIMYCEQLWASIKTVKSKISAIMHDVATQLKGYGDLCDTQASKATFLQDCEPVIGQDPEVRNSNFTLLRARA